MSGLQQSHSSSNQARVELLALSNDRDSYKQVKEGLRIKTLNFLQSTYQAAMTTHADGGSHNASRGKCSRHCQNTAAHQP